MADQTDDRRVPTTAVASRGPQTEAEAKFGHSGSDQPATSMAALLHEAKLARDPVWSTATDLPRAGSEAAHVAALSSQA